MIRKGTTVEWEWADGIAVGVVEELYREEVTREIKGNTITRKGSPENPAYLIVQEDGSEVLKLSSEVQRSDSS